MECHDVEFLLPFALRKCEALADGEKAALEQHLSTCPDCAAFANAERRADAAFSKVMLDVPVPADLSDKVMRHLAGQRPAKPWKWLAAAAAVLIAAVGIGVWHVTRPTDVTVDHVVAFVDLVEPFVGMPSADVEKYFADMGMQVKAPPDFDYDFLQHVEVIQFRNQPVGKLQFRRQLNNGVTAQAYVLVLPHSQFRVDQLPEGQLNHATSIEIKRDGEFTYVIYHRGNLGALRRLNIPA